MGFERMKKLAVSAFLVLMAAAFAFVGVAAGEASEKVVVAIDTWHSPGGADVDEIIGNMTLRDPRIEFKLLTSVDDFSATALEGVTMLIIGNNNGNLILEDEVISGIVSWFNTGGKTIWISTDSDYGPGAQCQLENNRLLEALNSKLRVDNCAIEDSVFNGGGGYRVFGSVFNHDPAVQMITLGLTRVLFHGPATVAGFVDGAMVPLETTTVSDVYWVAKTSLNGSVVENDALILAEVHDAGATGMFVLMAVEVNAGAAGDGKIIVSGETPYDGYAPGWVSSYHDDVAPAPMNPLNGPAYVMNTIMWGVYDAIMALPPEQVTTTATQLSTVVQTQTRTETQVSTAIQTQVSTVVQTQTETSTSVSTETVSEIPMYAWGIIIVLIIVIIAIGALYARK